jgi:hypothetical protein
VDGLPRRRPAQVGGWLVGRHVGGRVKHCHRLTDYLVIVPAGKQRGAAIPGEDPSINIGQEKRTPFGTRDEVRKHRSLIYFIYLH